MMMPISKWSISLFSPILKLYFDRKTTELYTVKIQRWVIIGTRYMTLLTAHGRLYVGVTSAKDKYRGAAAIIQLNSIVAERVTDSKAHCFCVDDNI